MSKEHKLLFKEAKNPQTLIATYEDTNVGKRSPNHIHNKYRLNYNCKYVIIFYILDKNIF